MPVHIFDEDAFERIVSVEGEEYRRNRSKERLGICSFEAFLEEWQEHYSLNHKAREFRPEFGIDVNGNGAIYGLLGFNRYNVLNSGEIILVRDMSTQEQERIKKERKAGFRVF